MTARVDQIAGPVRLRAERFGHSSKRKGGDHLVFLTTESLMIVTSADPKSFHEVRRYTIAPSTTYAHPIVLRDRVIVRDTSTVSVWALR